MAPRIDTLRAQVRREGFDTRRSKLWAYMRDHRTQIAEMREEGATWPAIGEAMRKLGLLDRKDKPPTNETVRQTWAKIEKEPQAKPRKAPQTRPALPGEPAVRGVPPERSVGGTVADISAEPEQPRRKFRRTATFRGTEETDGEA